MVGHSSSKYVCKLNNTLHNLPQVPKWRYKKLHIHLLDLKFKRSICNPCLNYNNIYLLVHIDDVLFSKFQNRITLKKINVKISVA